MDLTTKFRILETETEMLPVIERMMQFAVPEKRKHAVRLMAAIDQDIAKYRDEIDMELEWRR